MDNAKEVKHFKSKKPLMIFLLVTLIASILTISLLMIYLNIGGYALLIIGLVFGALGFISLIVSLVFLIIYQETVNAIKNGDTLLGKIIEIKDNKKTLFNRNDFILIINFYTKTNELCFVKEYVTKDILNELGYKLDSKVELVFYKNQSGIKNLL